MAEYFLEITAGETIYEQVSRGERSVLIVPNNDRIAKATGNVIKYINSDDRNQQTTVGVEGVELFATLGDLLRVYWREAAPHCETYQEAFDYHITKKYKTKFILSDNCATQVGGILAIKLFI